MLWFVMSALEQDRIFVSSARSDKVQTNVRGVVFAQLSKKSAGGIEIAWP